MFNPKYLYKCQTNLNRSEIVLPLLIAAENGNGYSHKNPKAGFIIIEP